MTTTYKYQKYPRTPHLPWSKGAAADDKKLISTDHFHGCEVVVTEKMDGENTAIYHDGHSHARSIDSGHHESRSHIKQLAEKLKHDLPYGYRVCGENLYVKHSIGYVLPSYFFVFGIINEWDQFLSWDDTCTYTELLGLSLVPVFYRGIWDEQKIQACLPKHSVFGPEIEGYVVRKAESFSVADFGLSVAKYVRPHHVQTDEHWMHRQITKNGLKIS